MSPSHGPIRDYLEAELVKHADRDSLDAADPELEQIELERAFCIATGLPLPEDQALRRERISDWQRLLEEAK